MRLYFLFLLHLYTKFGNISKFLATREVHINNNKKKKICQNICDGMCPRFCRHIPSAIHCSLTNPYDINTIIADTRGNGYWVSSFSGPYRIKINERSKIVRHLSDAFSRFRHHVCSEVTMQCFCRWSLTEWYIQLVSLVILWIKP